MGGELYPEQKAFQVEHGLHFSPPPQATPALQPSASVHNHVLSPCLERLLSQAFLSSSFISCMALGKSVNAQTICGFFWIMEIIVTSRKCGQN